MKVGFFNKKLLKQYGAFISPCTTAVSLILAFIDFSQECRIYICVILVMALTVCYIGYLIASNIKNKQNILINNTDVKIIYGDIFQQDGIKIIAFNEFFDTQADDSIIAKSSLNGQFLSLQKQYIGDIDAKITSDPHLNTLVVKKNVRRPQGGKTIKYRLGASCIYEDYLLLAFSHVDEENRAYLPFDDYISCLMRMWDEIDITYNEKRYCAATFG